MREMTGGKKYEAGKIKHGERREGRGPKIKRSKGTIG